MMKEEDAVDLLRHYRHDWMNQIQLLMGYASMGKLDKVQEKLKNSVVVAEKERNLEELDIPKTVLWIISFNWRYDNYRIDYRVDINDKTNSLDDNKIFDQFEDIMKTLALYGSSEELYKGNINFQQVPSNDIQVAVSFSGYFEQVERLEQQLLEKNKLHKVKIEQLSNENYKCTITWICS